MTYDAVLKDSREVFEKALHHLQDVLRGVRTSRASSALVDNIKVEYYGTLTPISQMATVSTPEPRLIVIKPFDASVMNELSKALMKSDLGITPQSDGKVLRLQMPPLSGEQREKYAAKVKQLCEDARIAMRNGRRDQNKHADGMKKDGLLTEDENRKLHDEIQHLLKEYETKLDGVQTKKIAEIMEV
jgi:ribosome recycling factor